MLLAITQYCKNSRQNPCDTFKRKNSKTTKCVCETKFYAAAVSCARMSRLDLEGH